MENESNILRYEYQMNTIEKHFLQPRRACLFCRSTSRVFAAGWTTQTGIWFRCNGHSGKVPERFIDVETGMPVFVLPDADGRDSIDAWMDEEGLLRV